MEKDTAMIMAFSGTCYRASARAIGGRCGFARTDSGSLLLDLEAPGSARAKAGTTSPEELFACGLAASFCEAMERAARGRRIDVEGLLVQVDVQVFDATLCAGVHVRVPGMSHGVAAQLVRAAYAHCAYTQAIRGNVQLAIHINNHTHLRAA